MSEISEQLAITCRELRREIGELEGTIRERDRTVSETFASRSRICQERDEYFAQLQELKIAAKTHEAAVYFYKSLAESGGENIRALKEKLKRARARR